MELKQKQRGKIAFHPLPHGRGLRRMRVKLKVVVFRNLLKKFADKNFESNRD